MGNTQSGIGAGVARIRGHYQSRVRGAVCPGFAQLGADIQVCEDGRGVRSESHSIPPPEPGNCEQSGLLPAAGPAPKRLHRSRSYSNLRAFSASAIMSPVWSDRVTTFMPMLPVLNRRSMFSAACRVVEHPSGRDSGRLEHRNATQTPSVTVSGYFSLHTFMVAGPQTKDRSVPETGSRGGCSFQVNIDVRGDNRQTILLPVIEADGITEPSLLICPA